MERGDVTALNELSMGDRFYCVVDTKKKVYQVVGYHRGTRACKADDDLRPVKMLDGTRVVFLRNVND